MHMDNRRSYSIIILGLALIPLAIALTAQYGFNLPPCEMCHWQRWPYFAIAGLALIILAVPRAGHFLILAVLLLFALDALIALFHMGVEEKWWQGFTTCSSSPLATSLEELRQQILGRPVIRCDEPAIRVLGLSMAGWNMLYALAACVTTIFFLRKGAKP